MAGLPGTGLGGVFYILLVMWMAVRETWLLGRAASHHSRWRKIAKLGTLAAAILAVLWLEGWLIYQLAGVSLGTASIYGGSTAAARELALAAITPMIAVAPFVVLVMLLVGIHTTRLLLRRRQNAVNERAANPAPIERQLA